MAGCSLVLADPVFSLKLTCGVQKEDEMSKKDKLGMSHKKTPPIVSNSPGHS